MVLRKAPVAYPLLMIACVISVTLAIIAMIVIGLIPIYLSNGSVEPVSISSKLDASEYNVRAYFLLYFSI